MSLNMENKEILKSIIQSRNPEYKLSFPIGNNRDVSFPIGKVSYIKADGILSKCFLCDFEKDSINIAVPFSSLEILLKKYAFIRVHRSYIINCSFIKNWDPQSNGILTLTCGTEIPIARRKKSEILPFLKSLGFDLGS